MAILVMLKRLPTGVGGINLEAMMQKYGFDGALYRWFIVHHENASASWSAQGATSTGGASRGSLKPKLAPPPVRFLAQISPPCASTSPFATARPSPRPLGREMPRFPR